MPQQIEKYIYLRVDRAEGGMEFEGDLADGLFHAARQLTEQERHDLADRLKAYSDRELMGS